MKITKQKLSVLGYKLLETSDMCVAATRNSKLKIINKNSQETEFDYKVIETFKRESITVIKLDSTGIIYLDTFGNFYTGSKEKPPRIYEDEHCWVKFNSEILFYNKDTKYRGSISQSKTGTEISLIAKIQVVNSHCVIINTAYINFETGEYIKFTSAPQKIGAHMLIHAGYFTKKPVSVRGFIDIETGFYFGVKEKTIVEKGVASITGYRLNSNEKMTITKEVDSDYNFKLTE